MIERRILIGMIFDRVVFEKLKKVGKGRYFESKEGKLIFNLLVPLPANPAEDFPIVVQNWEAGLRDPEMAELAYQFYNSITESEKEINPEVLIEEAIKYFKHRELQILKEDLEERIESGDWDGAEGLLERWTKVKQELGEFVDPFDKEEIIDIFSEEEKPLFKLPGDVGKMLNPFFKRDGFVAILAPEKRGKTWWLIEFAMRALSQRNKVVFFEVGDMSRRQVLKRIYGWVAGKSIFHQGKVAIPYKDCVKNQENRCDKPERVNKKPFNPNRYDPEYSPCSACKEIFPTIYFKPEKVEKLDLKTAVREVKKWKKVRKAKEFKLAVYPSSSFSAIDLRNLLLEWKNEGFIPDVVVIDYADLLAPIDSRKDYRHQINETWSYLRRISQEFHCLVITATQSDAAGHASKILTQLNFSEDKRKLAHVTGMIGINQTDREKEQSICRLNVIVAREVYFSPLRQVVVLQSLHKSRPLIDSFFKEGEL